MDRCDGIDDDGDDPVLLRFIRWVCVAALMGIAAVMAWLLNGVK